MLVFSGRSRTATVSLARPQITFLPGETIYQQADSAAYWYEVESGVARTCHFHPDGSRHVVGFFYPQDVFGLEQGLHSESAEAVTELVLARHDRVELREEPEKSSETFGRALDSARRSIFLFGRRTAPERVSAFLLMIADREGTRSRVPVPMCRSDIADHLGLTVHTVSRTITELARRGLIALKNPHLVEIKDRERLRALAGVSESESVLIEPRIAVAGVWA